MTSLNSGLLHYPLPPHKSKKIENIFANSVAVDDLGGDKHAKKLQEKTQILCENAWPALCGNDSLLFKRKYFTSLTRNLLSVSFSLSGKRIGGRYKQGWLKISWAAPGIRDSEIGIALLGGLSTSISEKIWGFECLKCNFLQLSMFCIVSKLMLSLGHAILFCHFTKGTLWQIFHANIILYA